MVAGGGEGRGEAAGAARVKHWWEHDSQGDDRNVSLEPMLREKFQCRLLVYSSCLMESAQGWR